MPRPRFEKLAPAQRSAILDAAVAEFAANGYAAASLNRIIEAAGISKGSMYYYFDGKEDLYAHVIRGEVVGLLERAGPVDVSGARDAGEYWETLTAAYLRLMRAMHGSPVAATLLRDWLGAGGSPTLTHAQRDAERELLPWVMGALESGQRVGAVRDDLPPELLLSVAMAMGQAIDVWLITSPPPDAELGDVVGEVMGMMRGALEPPRHPGP